MTTKKDDILTPDGTKISYMAKIPKSPKEIIHIFHGMGEHKNRYIPFMEFFASKGFIVVAHDHRKHGESIPKKGMQGIFLKSDTWDKVLHDASLVAKSIKKDYPNLPYTILGHSMGSVILRRFLIEYKKIADKAIIMGTLPPYSKAFAFTPIMLSKFIGFFKKSTSRSPLLAYLINAPLQKTYTQPRTKFDWLTHDTQVVDNYISDPLCGYAYSPRFYQTFFRGIVGLTQKSFLERGKNIPLLLISGEYDPVGDFGDGVKKVYEAYEDAHYTNLSIKLVEDARHEVLNEVNKQNTYSFILQWINAK